MEWRGLNNRESYAVTPVLSASLVIFIVTMAVSSFLFVELPHIDDLEQEGNFQELEVLCSVVADNMDEITANKAGEQKVIPFTVDNALISVDKDEYDTTVVIYSNSSNPSYEFSVTGLNDGDYQFNIIFDSGINTGQFDANVHWIDGELAGQIVTIDVGDEGNNGLVYLGDESFNLKGTVEILINDTDNSDILVGKIWLFDSNFLTCELTSDESSQMISIEKGGLICYNDQQSWVEKSFNLDAEDDYLQMKIVNFNASKSFSISGSNNVQTKITLNSVINKVREMKRLYFIKIQFYGHNAQTWINYIYNQYNGFVPVNSNTLFYSPSDPSTYPEYPDGVLTVFSHSLVEINTN